MCDKYVHTRTHLHIYCHTRQHSCTSAYLSLISGWSIRVRWLIDVCDWSRLSGVFEYLYLWLLPPNSPTPLPNVSNSSSLSHPSIPLPASLLPSFFLPLVRSSHCFWQALWVHCTEMHACRAPPTPYQSLTTTKTLCTHLVWRQKKVRKKVCMSGSRIQDYQATRWSVWQLRWENNWFPWAVQVLAMKRQSI